MQFVAANHKPGIYSVDSASQQKSITVAWWYHCRNRTGLRFKIKNTVSPSSGIFERQKRHKASMACRPSPKNAKKDEESVQIVKCKPRSLVASPNAQIIFQKPQQLKRERPKFHTAKLASTTPPKLWGRIFSRVA